MSERKETSWFLDPIPPFVGRKWKAAAAARPFNYRSESHPHHQLPLPSCVRVTCEASSSSLGIARGSVRVVLPSEAEGGNRTAAQEILVEQQGFLSSFDGSFAI